MIEREIWFSILLDVALELMVQCVQRDQVDRVVGAPMDWRYITKHDIASLCGNDTTLYRIRQVTASLYEAGILCKATNGRFAVNRKHRLYHMASIAMADNLGDKVKEINKVPF